MRERLPVQNAGSVPLCLFVEPYGEDFWLEPGEAVTVSAVSEDVDVQFAVTLAAEFPYGSERDGRRIPGPFLPREPRADDTPDLGT